MPFLARFVVSPGRVSQDDATARPAIESVAGKLGGRIVGGVGSATDPITVAFTEQAQAVQAAQELYYRDDIESARVDDVDNLATSTVTESVSSAVEAVLTGADVVESVDQLIEAKKKAKKGEKDAKDKPADDACDEAVNRWGHGIKAGMKVNVAHPRGGNRIATVKSVKKTELHPNGEIGLDDGTSANVDDAVPHVEK